ncbi:MAG: iron ABC transporter permease [Candidatus Methanomethylophilaceae archaeon]|nr:iron ABC transporter permease [Candidatus Methanomethylophilaceae archaeon]
METARKEEYYSRKHRNVLFIILCVAVIAVAFIISLSVGFYNIGFTDCIGAVIDHITGNITDERVDDVIWNTRLPIALFAVICGAALAAGGAVMQTVLRNPLADPYTMGISSGASLGASLSIILGITLIPGLASNIALILMAFVFSLIPVMVILIFTTRRKTTPTKIILIGIAVMYMFSAITSLLMVTASEESLAEVYTWNIGSLATVTWSSLPIPLIATVLGISFLMINNRTINTLIAGNNCAQSLGVNPKRTTLVLMVIISLMTASVVCYSGTIGFIGLVGPHIARIFVGSESRHLIPASAAFGALFLLCANTIARVAGDFGLPVGVICAIIGGPLFIIILVKMRKKVWR